MNHIKALLSTWRGRFIAGFLLVQILLPLHYYTVNHDPHDERFAWRMFSPMRMTSCSVNFVVDKKPVELLTEFHEAWEKIAVRGRFAVVEAMAARLCEKSGGKPVSLQLDCGYLDRPSQHFGNEDMCKRPEL